MAPLTYRKRVQTILVALARGGEAKVEYNTLVGQVRNALLQDSRPVGSRFRERIDDALRREKLSLRLKIVRAHGSPSTIELTDAGYRYFKGVGAVSLYKKGDPKFDRLTVDQLDKEIQVLRDVLIRTREVLQRHPACHVDVAAVEDMPKLCINLVTQIKTLSVQITELHSAHSSDRATMRALGISLY
ncbi:uncharacterized protein TRAVEDRAFT_51043 [Trametes versicolor FP-101664 SS1]|uniref:uncharacterized protein n=1 Tax=Trametes versicolor (strain FP-101664) TaxID=717944 RepID=UPI00046225C4|nr:uncharacterized protein TRAVEDRAFT_51043 [Trametes versicolor FP-101664 SS1]EIW54907.1 hypothetical protein TRAVEDRAFT_51043 [Trametes versicolor FP-101664 SS1]